MGSSLLILCYMRLTDFRKHCRGSVKVVHPSSFRDAFKNANLKVVKGKQRQDKDKENKGAVKKKKKKSKTLKIENTQRNKLKANELKKSF